MRITNSIFLACCVSILLSIYSCKKNDPPHPESNEVCKPVEVDCYGSILDNTLTLEYDPIGRITKLTANASYYTFSYENDNIVINKYSSNFNELQKTIKGKLNGEGLIYYQEDSAIAYAYGIKISKMDYNADGLLVTMATSGKDSFVYSFDYKGGNATTGSFFLASGDTVVVTYEYYEETNNNLFLLPGGLGDELMVSGLYGKISTNLLMKYILPSSLTFEYYYDFDKNENISKMYQIFVGDTVQIGNFAWQCK